MRYESTEMTSSWSERPIKRRYSWFSAKRVLACLKI